MVSSYKKLNKILRLLSLESTPKYQWTYDGNDSNVNTYGRLYTWYAATDSRTVCPTGLHITTYVDWTTLTTYSSERVCFRDMGYNFSDVLWGNNIKKSACSVRCVRDN